MSAEENKAIVRDYLEQYWNGGDEAKAEAVLAPGVLFHDLLARGDLPDGIDGVKQVRTEFKRGFPDFRMELEDIVAEGNKVCIRWKVTGTHLGQFQGIPPTGRRGTVTGMNFIRIQDRHIVEGWQELDVISLLEQLGVLPRNGLPRPIMRLITGTVRLRDRMFGPRNGGAVVEQE